MRRSVKDGDKERIAGSFSAKKKHRGRTRGALIKNKKNRNWKIKPMTVF